MTPTPSTPPAADPVDLLLVAALVVAEAAAVLLVAAAAVLLVAAVALLLTLAGWRPAAAPVAPEVLRQPEDFRVRLAPPPAPAEPPLAALRVMELRALARAAGHRQLARNGCRAELLQALA